MTSLFFRKRDGGDAQHWRCAVCREHRTHPVAGCYVRLANEIVAIVCDGPCLAELKRAIAGLLPDALPQVDAEGFLAS